MLFSINQQHVAQPLRALLLQQGVKLLAAAAEMLIATVAQRDNALTQIGLVAQLFTHIFV